MKISLVKNNRMLTAFTLLALTVVLVLGITSLREDTADANGSNGGFRQSVAGTYLVLEEGTKTFFLLTFTEDGNFWALPSAGSLFGFTNHHGTWERRDKPRIIVRSIVFSLDTDKKTAAPVDVGWDLTFANEVDGKFQNVSGTISVKVFAPGQNPLTSTAEPVDKFSDTLKDGQRVTVE